jgi:alpha-L-fucosidase 2
MTTRPRSSVLQAPLPWRLPARAPHSGVPLGNGTFGALLWGEGAHLRATINRADYWDHRGGLPARDDATYANLRRWLAAGDEGRLREVFEGRPPEGGEPAPRPTRLPMGRVDLEFPAGAALASASLDMAAGAAAFALADGARLEAVVLRDHPVLALRLEGPGATAARVIARPADAPAVREHYRSHGIPEAQSFTDGDSGGWVQECPGEPAMCAAWRRVAAGPDGSVTVLVASVYGETPDAARTAAAALLERVAREKEALLRRSAAWWTAYWEQCARVALPDATLELLYTLGMYKLAGLSVPGSPAATLQGPWIEEDRMPPWSGDYHWNINVQESYWPAYGGNQLGSLEPLFAMLRAWEPRLRENALRFAGTPDGLLMPHATDDRGTGMTGFWTGAVDHGSTAWTGQLMWQYYRLTLDERFLRETAYPFLKGCLRVYEAMLEEDGEALRLPVSVSPEFGGAGGAAWGANASFQLAIIHFLCRALLSASATLGVDSEERARWEAIDRRLPIGSLGPSERGEELLVWEGQPLTESHRHHSHLAGVYPFDIFDLDGSEREQTIVRRSMERLTRMGTGLWTGWCVPWAAFLYARLGNGTMAALLLETFRRFFMGPGLASTHDACFAGFTLFTGRPDIMQIEACMGASAAVLEMLVHSRGGVLRLFPAIPPAWDEAAFAGIRVEGAFLVSGEWRGGEPRRITVTSEAGAPLRIENPWGERPVLLARDGAPPERRAPSEAGSWRWLTWATRAGETLTLTPAS